MADAKNKFYSVLQMEKRTRDHGVHQEFRLRWSKQTNGNLRTKTSCTVTVHAATALFIVTVPVFFLLQYI